MKEQKEKTQKSATAKRDDGLSNIFQFLKGLDWLVSKNENLDPTLKKEVQSLKNSCWRRFDELRDAGLKIGQT